MSKVIFKYAPELYLGDSIKVKKLDKIKRKLAKNPLSANVYLLALASNERDQLEYFDSKWVGLRHYDGFEPYIVGICANESEALGLVERIAKECFDERGDCALREYLSC